MSAFQWLGATYQSEGVADPVYRWDLAGNWNGNGALPGLSDDVTIVSGVPQPVLQTSASINSLTVNAQASLQVGGEYGLTGPYDAASLAIVQSLTLNGEITVDAAPENAGGSSLSVASATIGATGTLSVGNDLEAVPTTATFGSLSSTGTIIIGGYAGTNGPPPEPPVQAEIVVNSAAGLGQAGVLTGNVQLGVGPGGAGGSGDALLDFTGGGRISTIAGGLFLTGPLAYVASGSATTSNSALNNGALTVAKGGNFALQDGVVITVPTLTNNGVLSVDIGFLATAGSSLTVTGQFDNSGGNFQIGRAAFSTGSAAPHVSVGSLLMTSTSSLSVDGDAGQGIAGVLDIGSAAGFGSAGALVGSVQLADAALIDFTGGGAISSIAGTLSLNGPHAFLASGTATSSNSALSGAVTVTKQGNFAIQDDVSVSVASLTNNGVVSVDIGFLATAGSNLTVTGLLDDSGGNFQIGRSAFSKSSPAPHVSAASLLMTSASTLSIDGDLGQKIVGVLDVGSAAGFGTAGALIGNVDLYDASLLDFTGGGGINTIAYGGNLVITSGNAFLASGLATTSNSALSGLANVYGSLTLLGGAAVNSTSLTLSDGTHGAYLNVDNSGLGGSTLHLSGALTTAAQANVDIGNGGMTTADNFSVGSLVNAGTITIQGNASASGVLDVGSQAGFGTAGVLTGNVNLYNASLLDFIGGGGINTIAYGGNLAITSGNAFLASGLATTSNSALSGLANVYGSLTLLGGAAVNSTSLTLSDGTHGAYLNVDNSGLGGSTLHLSGALTTAAQANVDIGNGGMTTADNFSVGSLVNAGTITIQGNASANLSGVLDVGSAAGFGTTGALSGNLNLYDASLLDFTGGGGINTIAYGGNLAITSGNAFLASGSVTTSNSALSGLANVYGSLTLQGGAAVNSTGLTLGDGTHGAVINVDTGGAGGSTLHLSGALSTTALSSINVGGGGMTGADAFSVGSLKNAGTITLRGNSNAKISGALDVGSAAGFGTTGALTGTVLLQSYSLLDFTGGGSINTIALGATLSIDTANAFLASGASTSANSALSNLATVNGSFSLYDGAVVNDTGGLSIGDGVHGITLEVNTGSTLALNGVATINALSQLLVGNSASSTSTVQASSFAINGGSLTLGAGASISGAINFTGGGQITLTNRSSATTVNGSGGTVNLNNSAAVVNGGGYTISLNGSATDSASLANTAGKGDTVNGSNGQIGLNAAAATVNGGGDTITMNGSAANSANLENTGGGYDTVLGSNGAIGLSNAVASIGGDGYTITLDGSAGNAANLYNTAGGYDTVLGSNGAIALNNAVASIGGAGHTITLDGSSADFANLYNTAANFDTVIGSHGKVGLNSAVAAVLGGSDTISLDGSSTDYANLFNTGANFDTVIGSGGKVGLNSAVAAVVGGSDTITLDGSSSDYANLFNTGANFDTVIGSGGKVGLNSAVAAVLGGSDTITLDGSSSDYANLFNTGANFDTVIGSGGKVGLNSAVAAVIGGSDTITLDGSSSDYANLFNTGANFDTVIGSGGKVGLNSAVAAVIGGSDTITLDGSSSDYANLFNTGANFDTVIGSGGKVGLNSAVAAVIGGSDTITLDGSSTDWANLFSTGANSDTVIGSNGRIGLNGVVAAVDGNSDELDFNGGSNTAALNGTGEALVFAAKFGVDSISGLAGSDGYFFSKSDFADFNALQAKMTPSGANNTLITLDAGDTVTLLGVNMNSLNENQFHFV